MVTRAILFEKYITIYIHDFLDISWEIPILSVGRARTTKEYEEEWDVAKSFISSYGPAYLLV